MNNLPLMSPSHYRTVSNKYSQDEKCNKASNIKELLDVDSKNLGLSLQYNTSVSLQPRGRG